MFKMLAMGSAVLSCLTVSFQTGAQEPEQSDCALAEHYYSLAQDRLGASEESEAAAYLERAGAACPRYAYFQELGELRMKTVNQNDRQLAVDAFIESHELASSDKERARALWKYAALLNQEGDPQNADRMIREARRLDAGNQEIADLATAIQVQIENPTREQLVRGLAASLYKPLHVVTSTGQSAGDGSSLAVPDASTASGDSASIRIPINFEFNSTTLDPSTSHNIELLANTLSDDEFQGRNFEFVGHADVRGDAQYNMELSRQRAYAIYEVVTGIDANLEGRISVSGLGESDPIELGDSEDAHRANRRLQILVK